MVELGALTVNAVLDCDESLPLVLESLTASESSENALLIESVHVKMWSESNFADLPHGGSIL